MEYFLDSNAHMPVCTAAMNAMVSFNSSASSHGNPMSPSSIGRLAANEIEKSRNIIGTALGVDKNNIIFTATATQACEWAVSLFCKPNDQVFCSPIEHRAITDPVSKIKHHILKVDSSGVVDLKYSLPTLAKVICLKVQPEIGTIQPVEKFEKPVLSDMTQALGKTKIDLSNIDFAIFGAHKFGGPNIGFMYVKNLDQWADFGSGSRYFLDRSGTPDMLSIVGAARALERCMETYEQRTSNCIDFRNVLEPALKEMGFDIIGDGTDRIPGTTFVECPVNAVVLMQKLAEEMVHVGLGSACGAFHTGPSPLMSVLGRKSSTNRYIRFSQFGEYNKYDAENITKKIKKALGR